MKTKKIKKPTKELPYAIKLRMDTKSGYEIDYSISTVLLQAYPNVKWLIDIKEDYVGFDVQELTLSDYLIELNKMSLKELYMIRLLSPDKAEEIEIKIDSMLNHIDMGIQHEKNKKKWYEF